MNGGVGFEAETTNVVGAGVGGEVFAVDDHET